MKNNVLIILSMGTLMFLMSCRASKNIASTPIPVRTTTELVDATIGHNIDYDWFCAKGKARFDTEEVDVGTKIWLRMKKDSIIWMTVKKLGVTAVQSKITPDSFFIIYRLERAYEKGSLQSMRERYQIKQTFGEMQDYFAGNIPAPTDTSKTTSLIVDRSYQLDSSIDEYKISTLLDPFNMRIQKVRAVDSKNNEIITTYDQYKPANNGEVVAYKRNFYISFDKGSGPEVSILKFDFSEILIDEQKTTNFSIPGHYEDISID